jgi:hypothetical protein
MTITQDTTCGAYLPESSLFEIRQTLHSGRAIFATQDIPKDTVVLSSDKTSIVVIVRQYRREICAQCFAYELGRNLKLRDAPTNFSFCGVICYETWRLATGEIGIQAWTELETYIKSKGGKGVNGIVNDAPEPTDGDGDISMGDHPRHPSKEEIDNLWTSVKDTAQLIRESRHGANLRSNRRAVQSAQNVVPHADSLYFLLSGILLHFQSISVKEPRQTSAWDAHVSLSPDRCPYLSAAHLRRHVHGYLQLLTILPVELLPSINPEVCRQTVMHDVHNAFGIRSLDDTGSEFFGWAVWPYASYFNHACASNIGKDRRERTWSFWTRSDVKAGEELTISYLGGDENDLTVEERGQTTDSIWGFICACARCLSEKAQQKLI